MKRLLSTSAITLMTFATTPALSETTIGDGFNPYGWVSLSYLDTTGGGDGEPLLAANTGFHWGFGGAWGIDAGLYGFVYDGDTYSAEYLALTYDFGNLRASVGKPRAAFDSFGSYRLDRQAALFGAELGLITNSLVTYTDLTGDATSYGLRLDGTMPNGSYALSLHGFDGVSNAIALSSGMRFDLGSDVELIGGFEYLDSSSSTVTKAKIGASKDFGQLQLGVIASVVEASGGSQGSYVELSGAYDFTDQFSAGLSVVRFDYFGSEQTLIGADVNYRFWEEASAFVAVVTSTDSGADEQYAVGLRYDF